MKLNKLFLFGILVTLLCPPAVMAQEKAAEKLGQVDFPVSCTAAAQKQFDQALAALHSFWYEEALRLFTAVAETDPGCAMAYWGIAMSIYYPLWVPPSQATLQKGTNAIEKAKSIGAKTEREGAYIAAIEVFYKDSDKLEHRARTLAYEKAMEQIHRQYPNDREAAIFYALALNATAPPTDKTYAQQRKAGEILEKVFAEQPDHPGVAHYIIHSYDNPSRQTVGFLLRNATSRSPPQFLTRSTCLLTFLRGSVCGKNRFNQISAPWPHRRSMQLRFIPKPHTMSIFMPWITWRMPTCKELRIGKPSAWLTNCGRLKKSSRKPFRQLTPMLRFRRVMRSRGAAGLRPQR